MKTVFVLDNVKNHIFVPQPSHNADVTVQLTLKRKRKRKKRIKGLVDTITSA